MNRIKSINIPPSPDFGEERRLLSRFRSHRDQDSRLNGIHGGDRFRSHRRPAATIKDIADSYRRSNAKAAVAVFLIYDVAFAMVMPV